MLERMAYLGIDCSTPYLALALYEGGSGLLASSCETVGRDHAARLPAALSTLFQKAELTPAHLQGVGVGVGPGSYTGLRVGVAAAKGIAQGLGIPLRGVSTLEAVAAGVLSDQEPRGVVALDARRGNVYAGVFHLHASNLTQIGELFKVERTAAQQRGLPYFEGVPPDAGYLAQCAEKGANTVSPLYL